ncbi:hypothetical protein DYU05_10685 [Mucilaginibacter terrenus]|uniref:Uncharacterized protein n=1 Tax=Mucilaginibacter terrenus TaxID=2482727 RepID=A0A3E2NNV4_9SPHI|nr:hypothetical protein [Mucilaginibacter terrenus]RFZ82643.1 hypothetical protein DYU05_10685 [Mucilaginibacter terrenus]
MKASQNILGGIAGSIALNLVHETVKRYSRSAPRVDLVGEDAIKKWLPKIGLTPPSGTNLYLATLAGDVISNAIYYSIAGVGKKKNVLLNGSVLGLAAGVGALVLTKPLGLSDAPVTRTNTTKALTVAWYLIGGVVAASVIRRMRK